MSGFFISKQAFEKIFAALCALQLLLRRAFRYAASIKNHTDESYISCSFA